MRNPLINENPSQSWQCLHTFTGYTSWIYGVFITPDGKTLVSSNSNEILLWDLSNGKLTATLSGHLAGIWSLGLSPNGKMIASGSEDKTVKLWNLETRELICTLAKRADPIHSVAFSPDGKILACGGFNPYKSPEGKTRSIYLWNPDTGELISTLSGHSLRIDSLAFSPDNRILVSHSYDKTIKIWNLETGERSHTITTNSEYTGTVAITPDGQNLVSSGAGGIKIWDLATGELLRIFAKSNIVSEDLHIRTFAISSDGKTVASDDHTSILIWDFDTGEIIHTQEFLWPISIAFSPNGKMLTSGSATGYEDRAIVKIWQVPSGLSREKTEDSSTRESEKLATTQENLNSDGYFNPESFEDARERTTTSIARRQGQPKFRSDLLKAYQGQCAITGFNAEQALEAAHIYPYKGDDTNKVWNGLLLRADIHTLFDLYLITVHPETKEILIAPELKGTSYSEVDGKKLNLPDDENLCPRKELLEWHYNKCRWV